jgi:hypothetical protein
MAPALALGIVSNHQREFRHFVLPYAVDRELVTGERFLHCDHARDEALPWGNPFTRQTDADRPTPGSGS